MKKKENEATIYEFGSSFAKAFKMIQKANKRRIRKISKAFLQSIFYLGSIVLMVYVGYSKDKDESWSLIDGIKNDQKNQKMESFIYNSDSTNNMISWADFNSLKPLSSQSGI